NPSFQIAAICFSHQTRIINEKNELRRLNRPAPASPFRRSCCVRELRRRRSSALHRMILFPARLRSVQQFKPPPFYHWRWIGFERLSEQPVQDSGSDALPRCALDFFDHRKESRDIFASESRGDQRRCIFKEENSIARFLDNLPCRPFFSAFWSDQIPLIQDDDRWFARLLNYSRNPFVLGGYAHREIDNEHT